MRRRYLNTKSAGLFSGGNGSPSNPFRIATVQDLRYLSENSIWWQGYNFTQVADIDMADSINWNNGAGFIPIGSPIKLFIGNYNGDNYIIFNLNINREGNSIGLFGEVTGASAFTGIKMYGLNYNIQGSPINVGGIVGNYKGTNNDIRIFEGCRVVGSIDTGVNGSSVGGLVGRAESVYLKKCTSDVNITGYTSLGGIIGAAFSNGALYNTEITECKANFASITGGRNSGGIVGVVNNATIENNYCSANTSIEATESNSYAGGIIGSVSVPTNGCVVQNNYSRASVTGNSLTGAVIGISGIQTINSNYWNPTDSAPATADAYATELTQAQMKQQINYAGWDFVNIWDIDPAKNDGFPFLRNNE